MQAIIDNLPIFLDGFQKTLLLLLFSGLIALVLGTVIAAMRISPVVTLRAFAITYTEMLRNTPLFLVLFFCATLLPLLGVDFDFFTFAVIGLSAYTSPFVAEALRSGINGVPVGQAEAARSIGLNFSQSITLVILPQAFRMTIPPLINVFIALTKNTSVASAFFVIELITRMNGLINDNGNAVIAIMLGTAVFYLLITVALGVIAGIAERRVAVLR